MLIHYNRNDLLNVHRDATSRRFEIHLSAKQYLSNVEEVCDRGIVFEFHETPQCSSSVPL